MLAGRPGTQNRGLDARVPVHAASHAHTCTVTRSLPLPQVVGRVHKGREMLDKVGDLRTLPPDDA